MFNDLSQAAPGGTMSAPPAESMHKARAEALAASDTGLWERADARNPDPSRFCPVQITGFNALHERRAQQLQASRDLAAQIRASQEKLRALDDERKAAIDLRLRHYSERQQQLSSRVLRLMAALERQHLLRCHGGDEPPLTAAESSWIRQLQGLVAEMERPDAGLARLYELSVRLQQQAAAGSQAVGMPAASRLHVENLQEWLGRQQEGVRKLIDVAQTDLDDVAVAVAEARR